MPHIRGRFAPVQLSYAASRLSPGDRKALDKLIEAARVMDWIFLDQLWSGNRALYERLQEDTERLHDFWLNKGPWSDLDDHRAFLPGVPERKPLGGNFYPEDMSREEFEQWATEEARGFFTVVRRDVDRHLILTPYSEAYAADLQKAAELLREAAKLTDNESLRRYLTLRADAFLSNDYYESDVAWMDLDAPLDITIGPYETYQDELFGYKAAFEAYITVRDDELTDRLREFSTRMQEVEDHLPIEAKYRNPKIGESAPIRVVNQIYAAGDGAHGVRTAAFNLPNDERVVQEKGSKRVMLHNVQQAKFERILKPIAARVLPADAQSELDFDAFFTHILAHELSHGIGPQANVRRQLKELYSPLEEAKADITGLFMLEYLGRADRRTYTTFLASAFRSVRFGITEAHGRGMVLQFNYLSDRGAFVANADGTFSVDAGKIGGAVRDLAREILTIEAEGNYREAKRMLDTLAVIRPDMQRALDRLKDLPTDIEIIEQ